SAALGAATGSLLGVCALFFERFVKRLSLRAFNTITLGLFFGSLSGLAINHVIAQAIGGYASALNPEHLSMIAAAIYLCSIYLGIALTSRGVNEFHVCLPFVKFKSTALKKKDILPDA